MIACGSRTHTFRDFKNALKRHPDAFNVLLVDSEGPVRKTPWLHLQERDGWRKPPKTTDEQCHLMVQMMEAWFIADVKTLEEFYQKGFNANAIPKTKNIEQVSKKRIEQALKLSTKRAKKGTYHKMKHGPAILAQINVSKIRAASVHCDRLLTVLAKKLKN